MTIRYWWISDLTGPLGSLGKFTRTPSFEDRVPRGMPHAPVLRNRLRGFTSLAIDRELASSTLVVERIGDHARLFANLPDVDDPKPHAEFLPDAPSVCNGWLAGIRVSVAVVLNRLFEHELKLALSNHLAELINARELYLLRLLFAASGKFKPQDSRAIEEDYVQVCDLPRGFDENVACQEDGGDALDHIE